MPSKPKTPAKPAKGKTVATLRHGAKRKNLPTVEYESLMRREEKSPIEVAYERRNHDLDPQFVWRGKDNQDWSNLVVPAPPLYIQEKAHPRVLIDDLLHQSKARAAAAAPQIDLFADFNGLPRDARATEFYRHDAHWTNRMILGDSLQVMASLAEREGLRGKVHCIYVDPPYGIKFNSNFQWSITSRDVKDGKADHITRKPEQVKAFRDTWRDGIACWFIDTDYNEESFFVRHAYFLGASDPYQSLKTTLKAEIDQEAWESLHSAISRPFTERRQSLTAPQ